MRLNVFHNNAFLDNPVTLYEWIGKTARFILWFDNEGCTYTWASKPSEEHECEGEVLTIEQLKELRDLIDKAIQKSEATP